MLVVMALFSKSVHAGLIFLNPCNFYITGTIMSEEATQTEEKKNKKINNMTLSEIESALKKTEEHMKGLNSKYAKSLLTRKSELSSK